MDSDLPITRRETYNKMLAGVRLSESMLLAIEARSRALKCTVSEYVRALVQRDLDAQTAIHPQRASAKPATR